MIGKRAKKYCKNFELIENYEKAVSDDKLWDVHHRLEDEGYTYRELIALKMYYNRPPEELIFIPKGEHQRMHLIHKPISTEHRQKISESLKGKPKSDEHKQKMSEVNKGKKLSEDTKRKISESESGEKHWNYGNKWDDETKKRNGLSQKTRKEIIQLDMDGNEIARYYSIKEAARKNNLTPSAIGFCLSDKYKNKTAGGYQWKLAS